MAQLYYYKKNFDTQKAIRWFKERNRPLQLVDLTRTRMGLRELEAVRQRVGLPALIDSESNAWKECPARFAAGEEAILKALSEDPRRLRLPILRHGKEATVGYQPDAWETWE